MLLQDKIAVVTGASRGIGRATAKALAREGAMVIVNYNGSKERADEVVSEIEKDGGKAKAIQCNVAGVFNGIKFVTRPMMKQRQGHIINMASVSGIIGNMGQANYSASKAGVIGLTKATAKELSSRGITVNAVAPGFIATEMTDKLSDAVKEEACKTIPLGAFGTVEDVAEAVVFLASDRAKYITGQVLCVDGGIAM